MSYEKVSAEEIGCDNLGSLAICSGWVSPSGFIEVHHTVPADFLYVDPKSVVRWDAQPVRQNSIKRFAHMLRWRGVAPLGSVASYRESLESAIASNGLNQPPDKRLVTLLNHASRYHREAEDGQKITRLATAMARILFRYEPPIDDNLNNLHEYLSNRM